MVNNKHLKKIPENKEEDEKKNKDNKTPAFVRRTRSTCIKIVGDHDNNEESESGNSPIMEQQNMSPTVSKRSRSMAEHEDFTNCRSPAQSRNLENDENKENEDTQKCGAKGQSPGTIGTRKLAKPAKAQVVVWGKVLNELLAQNQKYRKLAEENRALQLTQLVDPGSSMQQPVAGDASTQDNDGTSTSTRRTRASKQPKRDPELITKAEHYRLLRSAVKNTMKMKVSDIMGMSEEEEMQVPKASLTTRGRRKLKEKVVVEGGITIADPSRILENENPRRGRRKRVNDEFKPGLTYTELIEVALTEHPEGLTVSEIYAWISSRHPYFEADDARWKNSVRHNLSINPVFQKSSKSQEKSGHVWIIQGSERPASDPLEPTDEPSEPPPPPAKKRPYIRRKSQSKKLKKQLTEIVNVAAQNNPNLKDEPQSQGEEMAAVDEPLEYYAVDLGDGIVSYISKFENRDYYEVQSNMSNENYTFSNIAFDQGDGLAYDGCNVINVENLVTTDQLVFVDSQSLSDQLDLSHISLPSEFSQLTEESSEVNIPTLVSDTNSISMESPQLEGCDINEANGQQMDCSDYNTQSNESNPYTFVADGNCDSTVNPEFLNSSQEFQAVDGFINTYHPYT